MSDEIIEDGYGNAWSITCHDCGQDTMGVVRPGQVQCNADTGPCSVPHCSICGYRHESPAISYRERHKCPCRVIEYEGKKICTVYFHHHTEDLEG